MYQHHAAKTHEAAIAIQAMSRGLRGRLDFKICIAKEEEALVIVQALIRGKTQAAVASRLCCSVFIEHLLTTCLIAFYRSQDISVVWAGAAGMAACRHPRDTSKSDSVATASMLYFRGGWSAICGSDDSCMPHECESASSATWRSASTRFGRAGRQNLCQSKFKQRDGKSTVNRPVCVCEVVCVCARARVCVCLCNSLSLLI